VQQTPARLGTPDSVRCARLVRGNSSLSGLDDGVRLKITGPSGGAPDCPVSHPWRTHRPREKQRGNIDKIHRTVRWCTGLSGEPTVAWATVGRAIFARHVDCSNGQLVHRTVRCAPDSVRCANQPRGATIEYAKFGKEIAHRTVYRTCPVAHRTVWCATRQKAGIAFQDCLQRLLAALGL
jgi:hypothetical protein